MRRNPVAPACVEGPSAGAIVARIRLVLLLLGAMSCLLAARSVAAHPHDVPAAHGTDEPEVPTTVLDLSAVTDIERLLPKLEKRRVVFVGETHDRYEHHLNQLQIIKGLYRRNPDLVIAMEFFQQPFQEQLDRFVRKEIDERAFLESTEYFTRWRYDYRLYRPILTYAREKGIPLLALNVPSEISEKVARQGVDGLSVEERKWVPDEMDRSNQAYEKRLREVFNQHPTLDDSGFDFFVEAQLLWDEGMADRAARYLRDHPGRQMVLLAGSGHLEFGDGIPKRLMRRMPVETTIVLNGLRSGLDPAVADFLLLPEAWDLPPHGLLGVRLETDAGAVSVKGFSDTSGAQEAGVREGDRIVRIGGQQVASYTDVRFALIDRAPGDKVQVDVVRERLLLGDTELSYQVELR